MRRLAPREAGLAAAGLALALDQGTKLFLLYGAGFIRMGPGQAIPISPFFNLVMVWNSGISYGLFPATGPVEVGLLVALTFGVIAGLIWWLWNCRSLSLAIGLGLIVGGAIGNNVVDRVIYGKVADFFHFYAFGYSWYVFNVADAAITLGAIAIIYDVMKPEHAGGGQLGVDHD